LAGLPRSAGIPPRNGRQGFEPLPDAQVAAEGARDYYEDADALAYLGTAVLANRGRDPL
jgi:hypothetical protein